MNISAIGTTYSTNNYYHKNMTAPSFKGALNQQEANRVITKLGKFNSEVLENFNISDIDKLVQHLIDKYRPQGARSAAIQVVSNKDLPLLLGENMAKYDTRGKIGLCVAIGDKSAPVEHMDKIFEAKTVLVREEVFGRR